MSKVKPNGVRSVAEVVKRVRRDCNSYPLPNAAGEKLKLVREIEDAHKRELAEKDEEIEKLKKENASLRVINCGNYYAECNLREEIERLRALVKELADVVATTRPKFCNGCPAVLCAIGGKLCGFVTHADELIARAREVVK